MRTRTRPPKQGRSRPINLERSGLLAGGALLGLLLLAGMGAPRNWWTRNQNLSFRTYSASGLSPGMPVMISGYPVGRVQRLRLLNDAQVQVDLVVGADRRSMIGSRSRATLAQDTLLGQPYIAISPDLHDLGSATGGSATGASGDDVLIYEPSPGLASLIKELAASRIPLQEMIGSAARLAEQRLPQSLDQLDKALGSGTRLAQTLEQELVGKPTAMQQSLSSASGNLERTLNTLQTTLQEIQSLARSSNTLLQGISRSWLLQLLEPAQPNPPATRSPDPGPSAD
jgi:ABC-type transporter Mla subunit MlaD